ncbi:MAG TPA: hypothetical protein V6D11_27185 [Waterburya sp.]|jgi:hypothetical protein
MWIKKLTIPLSVFILLLCWLSSRVDASYQARINSITSLADDMTTPCDGMPHGVPTSYDWASNPRVGWGNTPPQGFQAMTAWGQAYEAATGNSATNTRIQIRNIRAYMLSKRDGQWHLLQDSTRVEGAAYREDYADNVSKSADIRDELDGSISVKVGQGYNFHFWPPSRVPIDPNDVGGIFTTVQARLIMDNPQQTDDTMQARYLLSMGGDYWVNLTADWDDWKTNADIGIGKLKYVTPNWQAFNMTTLSAEQILQNPPPIE